MKKVVNLIIVFREKERVGEITVVVDFFTLKKYVNIRKQIHLCLFGNFFDEVTLLF